MALVCRGSACNRLICIRIVEEDEFGFLGKFHPRRIDVATQNEAGYALVFPKQSADQVAHVLEQELLARGWRKELDEKAIGAPEIDFIEPAENQVRVTCGPVCQEANQDYNTIRYGVRPGERLVEISPQPNWFMHELHLLKSLFRPK